MASLSRDRMSNAVIGSELLRDIPRGQPAYLAVEPKADHGN